MDQNIFQYANGRYLNKSDLDTYAYQLSKSYLFISLNNLKSYLSTHSPMIIVLNSLESYASKGLQCSSNVLASVKGFKGDKYILDNRYIASLLQRYIVTALHCYSATALQRYSAIAL